MGFYYLSNLLLFVTLLYPFVTNGYNGPRTDVPETVPLQTNLDKIVKTVQGTWEDFSKQFSSTYENLRNLFGDNKQELMQKVNETQKYFSIALEHKEELLQAAGRVRNLTRESFKPTLDSLNEWFKEVTHFQQRLLNSTASDIKNLTAQWTKKMTDHWNEGLQNIIEVTKNMQVSEEERRQSGK